MSFCRAWLFGMACLLSLLPASGNASQNLNFQHYTIHQGLPQTQVRVIHQGARGYLWVGTYGGLGRYNGREFTVFTTNQGLNSNTIEAISGTPDGRIWAGTTNGLCYLQREADHFQCLDDASIRGAHVQALLPTATGGLWIGTNNGLLKLEDDRITAVHSDAGIPEPAVTSLARDTGGGLWIGSLDGLYHLDASGNISVQELPAESGMRVRSLLADGTRLWIGAAAGLYVLEDGDITAAPGLPDDWPLDDVNSIAQEADGDIWAATDQGVLRQRDSDFELLTTDSGLRTAINFTVFIDREGIVFLGHDDGMSKYTAGPFSSYTEANGLLHYFVRTINEDADGRLWLGTRSGAQIVPFVDGEWQVDQSHTITGKDGLSDTRIYSIALVSPDDAWLATGNGVVRWREGENVVDRIDRSDGLPDDATQALYLQEDGRLWIGTNYGVRILQDGAIRMPPDAALAEAYVYRIREDVHGRLWFGSQEHGVFIVSPQGDVQRLQKATGLTDETIWDIAPDDEGGMWIGSNGDGLFHVTADGGITQYTTEDGMVDNFVWQVLVDETGDVWGYTNRGITRYDGTAFRNYGIEDGLLHLEGGATGAWQSQDGSLWFASADGLMRYEDGPEHDSAMPPPVIVEQVEIGDRRIVENEQLAYKAGSINFRYAALSYQQEDRVLYSYRLRGADKEWSRPVAYRPVTYANLAGGEYVFEVRARNSGSDWSDEPARFRFTVAPPYWATAWFWALALAGLVFVVSMVFRFRIRRIEAHRRELQEQVAEQTRELKAANDKLLTASITDPLTGLNNRRYLTTQIHIDVAQARRAYRGPQEYPNRDIVFMMIDLDNFKEINDTHGHGAGDRVLCQYAALLDELMRESDYIVRWGGEEFLVVARQTEASQCSVIAERIVQRVRDMQFLVDEEGTMIDCTCSIGLSHFPFLRDNPELLNWEQVIDVADMAVYMAKDCGRNGWVAIQGLRGPGDDDYEWFMQALRHDLRSLVDNGYVAVESSFDDALGSATDDQPPPSM